MAFEVRDMTGSMFRNTRKESPNHPDYTGSGKIDGRDAWINCWEKQDKNGNTYFSFAFKWKDGTSARPEQFAKKAQDAFGLPETPAVKTRGFDPEDGIPF